MTGIATSDYLSKFPCYQDQRCMELLHHDIINKYPNVGNLEESNWKNIKTSVLENGSKRLKRNKTLKVYFDLFNNSGVKGTVNQQYNYFFSHNNVFFFIIDIDDLLAFLTLPYLFPTVNKKNNKRPSLLETQKSFVSIFAVSTELT